MKKTSLDLASFETKCQDLTGFETKCQDLAGFETKRQDLAGIDTQVLKINKIMVHLNRKKKIRFQKL